MTSKVYVLSGGHYDYETSTEWIVGVYTSHALMQAAELFSIQARFSKLDESNLLREYRHTIEDCVNLRGKPPWNDSMLILGSIERELMQRMR